MLKQFRCQFSDQSNPDQSRGVLITILWVEGQGAQKCLLPFTLKWIYWKIYMYKQTKQFRFQFSNQSNLIFITGHGPQTGRCVLNDKRDRYGNITVCEIQSWYQSLQCIGFLHVYYMICINIEVNVKIQWRVNFRKYFLHDSVVSMQLMNPKSNCGLSIYSGKFHQFRNYS